MIRNLARKLVPKKYQLVSMLVGQIKKNAKNRVASGLFAGMKFEAAVIGSADIPRILGTYEIELSPVFSALNWSEFEKVIDVGAAEGYYAVGLALRPDVRKVVAFEAASAGRDLITRIAALNEVDGKVEVHGFCDVPALAAQISACPQRCALIVDIEGGEATLLDPRVIPELRHTLIIVEVHEFAIEDISTMLIGRFSTTHKIDRVNARPRVASDFPSGLVKMNWVLRRYGQSAVEAAMSEGRPNDMFWYVMTPLPRNAQMEAA